MTISHIPAPRDPQDRQDDVQDKGQRLSPRTGQEAKLAAGIVRLLDRHRELRGVHAMADFLDDSVRWTA